MDEKELEKLGLSAEQVKAVCELHAAEMQKQSQTISTLEAEKGQLETQLGEANKTLQGYDPEWKAKAEQAQKDAESKVNALRRDFAAKECAAALHFSSESAKRAFLADFAAKELPLQNGKFLGFDDYVKAYRESDPAAFRQEEDNTPPPRFSAATPGASGGATDRDRANAAIRAAFGATT